jgi:hypothetical protein
LRELAQTCRRHRVWLHADGAWGGAVIFSQTHRALVDGLERSFFSSFFLFFSFLFFSFSRRRTGPWRACEVFLFFFLSFLSFFFFFLVLADAPGLGGLESSLFSFFFLFFLFSILFFFSQAHPGLGGLERSFFLLQSALNRYR